MVAKVKEADFDPKKHVKEYKRTCKGCGKVWHSLASREDKLKTDSISGSCVQASTACSGNLGAATQSQRNVQSANEQLDNLKKCPQCGSSNYNEEVLVYEKKH